MPSLNDVGNGQRKSSVGAGESSEKEGRESGSGEAGGGNVKRWRGAGRPGWRMMGVGNPDSPL